jgi:hypothetical protein
LQLAHTVGIPTKFGGVAGAMSNDRLKRNLWFAYLSVLLCWAIQAYLLIGQYLQEGTLFAHLENGRPYICDFVGWYSMAYLAKRSEQEHVDLYDPTVQAETEKLFTAPIVAENPFVIPYPPWFFSLLRPLCFLPLTQAYLVWDILGALTAGSAICLLAFEFHKSIFARAFVIVAVFASFPTWLCFRLGQTSWVNFAAVASFWWLIGKQRSFLAGVAASAFTIKVQYLPLPFLVGLILGRLRFFLGFALITTLLVTLALNTVGLSNITSYPQAVLRIDASRNVSGVSPEVMQNLRGALVLLTYADDHFVHIATIVFLALVIVSGTALFLKRPTETQTLDRDFQIKASVCSLLMLIASPHTHVQDYLVATVPAIWLWQAVAGRKAPVLKTLILAFPVLSWLFFVVRPLFALARIQPFFVWALVVIFLAIKELRHPSALVEIEAGKTVPATDA